MTNVYHALYDFCTSMSSESRKLFFFFVFKIIQMNIIYFQTCFLFDFSSGTTIEWFQFCGICPVLLNTIKIVF